MVGGSNRNRCVRMQIVVPRYTERRVATGTEEQKRVVTMDEDIREKHVK